jgi:hypothetical protein
LDNVTGKGGVRKDRTRGKGGMEGVTGKGGNARTEPEEREDARTVPEEMGRQGQ